MKIGTTKLIAENVAPPNAKSLAIYDGTKRIGTVDISHMRPTNLGERLYSFGLLSDVHCNTASGNPNPSRFDNALTYFETQGVDFCCVSGDLTNIGFYQSADATEIYRGQFAEYKRICDLHPNLPVYECCGNHESYYGRSVTENLDLLEQYTGQGLTYTMSWGDDVFVFVGQSQGSYPMSDADFAWLEETLEANKNKRCFVFIHPYVRPSGSISDAGDPLRLHKEPLFTYWGSTKTNDFIALMSRYPNAVLFHGHSHMDFENQFVVPNANYSTVLGFKSVHIPSTAYTRNVITGAIVENKSGAQGYICDVYAGYIVLKGYDFTEGKNVPIAQYCLDTTLQTIAADTFTDSTGTITT